MLFNVANQKISLKTTQNIKLCSVIFIDDYSPTILQKKPTQPKTKG